MSNHSENINRVNISADLDNFNNHPLTALTDFNCSNCSNIDDNKTFDSFETDIILKKFGFNLFLPKQQLLLESCLVISLICLLIHLTVYSFVPKLRNLPGKCLMSLSFALFLTASSYIVSFNVQISPDNLFCLFSALIRLYSLLAAFFWMSVMAFDVYKTFKCSIRSSRCCNHYRKYNFFKYSIYAWTIPAGIVMMTAIIQKNLPLNHPLNPAYGLHHCGISHLEALLIYFLLPVGIILFGNVVLFILTVRQLIATTDEIKLANRSSAKDKLIWFIKLVIVLGLTWIFCLTANFVDIPYVKYPFIVLEGLHGALIFITFTLKRNVYNLIILRIRYLRGERHLRSSFIMNRSQNSLSSKQTTIIPLNEINGNGYYFE